MASGASLGCLPPFCPPAATAAVRGEPSQRSGGRGWLRASRHRAGSPGALGRGCCLWARLPGLVPAPGAAGWSWPSTPWSLLSLFQFLECPDITQWHNDVLHLLIKYLWRESSGMRRLGLRSLIEFCQKPSLVRRGSRLKQLAGSMGLAEGCWVTWQHRLGWASGAVAAAASNPASLVTCWSCRGRHLASGRQGSSMGPKGWSGLGSAAFPGFTAQRCVPHRPEKCGFYCQVW